MLQWRNIVKRVTVLTAIMIVAACAFVILRRQETAPTLQEAPSTALQEAPSMALQEAPFTATIPTISRADTRHFVNIRYARQIDISYIWSFSQTALPNEIAFCLYGHAADTTMIFTRFSDGEQVELVRKIAVIDSVFIANIEIAAPTYIQFTGGIACDPNPRLIGTAHTHPNTVPPQMGGRCSHSDLDVLYAQNRETEYWFTLVLCTWTHELMWADGRRLEYYVRNPSNSLESEPESPDTN